MLVEKSAHSLVVKKEIRTVKDLRGKKISYTAGGPPEWIVREMLASGNLTMKDVVPAPMPSSRDRFAALVSDAVDASLLNTRYTSRATARLRTWQAPPTKVSS